MARKRQRKTAPGKSGDARATAAASRPVFEAFALGLEPATEAAQRAIVRTLARRAFPKGGKIEFLARLPKTKAVARDVILTAPADATLEVGEVWALARDFEHSDGVRYAEPLFDGPGLEPEPRTAKRLLAPHERNGTAAVGKKSGGGDKPLPCAGSDVLWSLGQIKAVQAWTLPPPTGGVQFGEGIVVGHPDTGYQPHEEIWSAVPSQRRVRPQDGYDFEDSDSDPLDPMSGQAPGHGTATASVIMSGRAEAGETTLVGIAPAAQLVPIRVSDSVIHLSFKNVTKAIYHAVDKAGAHVISMSLGGPFASKALEAAVEHAISRGVIVLAAAGNVWPWVVYPAKLDRVVAVAASNCNAVPWSKSASGSKVDITAPGESVWRAKSEKKQGGVTFSIAPGSGTSYAVANVAGACATWLAFHGRATLISKYGEAKLAGVFMSLLKTQGFWTPAGWNTKKYGPGILDVARLLSAPLPALPKVAKSIKKSAKTISPQAAVIEQIEGYFPELSPAQVRAVIKRSFMPGASDAARRRGLRELGPELVFHVAANADVRSRIHEQAKRGTKGTKTVTPAGNALRPAKRAASPALRQAIQ